MASRLAESLRLGSDTVIRFDAERDIIFDFSSPLEGHANGLVLEAFDADGKSILQRTYFSIGGGFVMSVDKLIAAADETPLAEVPHGFKTAVEMLSMGDEGSISIAGMKMANEATVMSEAEVRAGLDRIWAAMEGSIERGLRQTGDLPGPLGVKRRARTILESLEAEKVSASNIHFEHIR